MPRFEVTSAENARAHGLNLEPNDEAWVEFASNVKKNRVGRGGSEGFRWAGVIALVGMLAAASWALWEFELRHMLFR